MPHAIAPPIVEPPENRRSLVDSLDRTHLEIDQLFAAFSEREFFAAQGEFWSPAEHLDHLCRSVGAVRYAFGMPKAMVLLRFGPSWRASRGYQQVVDLYLAALAGGGRAGGRFLPEAAVDEADQSARRDNLLERWRRLGHGLQTAVFTWGDFWLDRCRLPHPLIGKMTCREILLFTLYHNIHHARRVAERRGG